MPINTRTRKAFGPLTFGLLFELITTKQKQEQQKGNKIFTLTSDFPRSDYIIDRGSIFMVYNLYIYGVKKIQISYNQ